MAMAARFNRPSPFIFNLYSCLERKSIASTVAVMVSLLFAVHVYN